MLKFRTFQFLRNQVRNFSVAVEVQDNLQKAALKEMCILVDKSDNYIGEASKEDCHRVHDGNLLLHRAFSVYLFNSKNEFLLQQRSPYKVTFPNCYTNTCCSHPLNSIKQERIEENALGIKLAALRRLNYELGIPLNSLSASDMTYLTRIIYKSVGDGVWGEYEIDYILFIHKDVPLDPNPNEVSDFRYIEYDKFTDFMKNLKAPVTPWFQLISQHNLLDWWKNLDNIRKFKDHKNIISYL